MNLMKTVLRNDCDQFHIKVLSINTYDSEKSKKEKGEKSYTTVLSINTQKSTHFL